MKNKLYLFLISAFILLAAGCGKEEVVDSKEDDIDSLIGTYYLEGSRSSWRAGLGGDTTYAITDTGTITKVNDSTLLFRGDELPLYTGNPAGPTTATPDTYTFLPGCMVLCLILMLI